jgi:hypothetical protein
MKKDAFEIVLPEEAVLQKFFLDQGSESDAGQGSGIFVWGNYTQAERAGKKKYFPVS